MSFHISDYMVLFFTLLTSCVIGIYVRFSGGRQRTVLEHLMADRNMKLLPVCFSLMASFMSAVTLIGVSNEIYQFGIQFFVANFGYLLFTPIAAYLFLPVFYEMKVTSVYEYLEKRFGKLSRTAASIAYAFQMILYMAIVLYAPAISLQVITSISREIAVLSVGLVCTFYSTIGGMKAVLLTDVFQSFLMFAGIFAVIISGLNYAGWNDIINVAGEGGRLEFWNFDIDPTVRHTWFTLLIGGGFTFMALYAINQTEVQRLLTIKKLRTAQWALWCQWPILAALSMLTCFSGLVIYYYYRTCDPLLSGRISVRDQNMPLYVIDSMNHLPGLAGLFVSGIFAAGLSSISSCLNSLSTVTLEDYFKPIYGKISNKILDDITLAVVSKFITTFYGVLIIMLALLGEFFGNGVLQAALTIFGILGGPLLGLFTLGMISTRPNEKGSVLGLLIGIVFGMWIGFAPKPPPKLLPFSTEDCSQFLSNHTTIIVETAKTNETEYFYLYRLSYMYTGALTFFVTLISGFVISEMFFYLKLDDSKSKIYIDKSRKIINPYLFFPPLAKWIKKKQEENLNIEN